MTQNNSYASQPPRVSFLSPPRNRDQYGIFVILPSIVKISFAVILLGTNMNDMDNPTTSKLFFILFSGLAFFIRGSFFLSESYT